MPFLPHSLLRANVPLIERLPTKISEKIAGSELVSPIPDSVTGSLGVLVARFLARYYLDFIHSERLHHLELEVQFLATKNR